MRKWSIVVLGLALLAPPAVAQQMPQSEDRRAELEQQVRHRFMMQVARRLQLSEPQREGLMEVLREGAEARQELAEASRALRHDLMQAVRTDDTEMATYEAILARLQELRERERAIEQREEARLADVLDARQRALFLIMRMEFNERIRGMRGPGGRGGGPGGGGPGAGMGGGPPAGLF